MDGATIKMLMLVTFARFKQLSPTFYSTASARITFVAFDQTVHYTLSSINPYHANVEIMVSS